MCHRERALIFSFAGQLNGGGGELAGDPPLNPPLALGAIVGYRACKSRDSPASGGANAHFRLPSPSRVLSLYGHACNSLRFFQQYLPEWRQIALFMGVIISMDESCVRDFGSQLIRRFTDTGRSCAGMNNKTRHPQSIIS